MVSRVAKMLHSQNNVGLCNNIFWRQSEYMNISAETLIFVSDRACHQIEHTGQNEGFVSVGDFHREGEFVYFAPHLSQPVQLSNIGSN